MQVPTNSADQQVSLRQAGAGGALRCAIFAIDDAVRHLEWHYQEAGLPRDEYLRKVAELNGHRRVLEEGLKPLWQLAGAVG